MLATETGTLWGKYGLPLLGLVVIAFLGFWLSQTAAPRPEPTPSSSRLQVLTTFFPLYDFTRAVGGDRIELDILFTQTPEVASFRPADIQKINAADVLIQNGVGLEPVLADMLQSSDNKDITVVDTSHGVAVLNSAEETHEDGAGDPHIWLDPTNAVIQVQNIRDALMHADPANASFYQNQAAEYLTKLQQLDKDCAVRISALPKKEFVAFHAAFRYFANRYGLHQVAVIEEFPGKEPSPQYLAGVIATIRQFGISAIFVEPQFSPKVMEAIAHDLGLTVRVLDPIETGSLERDSYISLMHQNLQTLEEALH